jgi:predicted nucleotidyltransferase
LSKFNSDSTTDYQLTFLSAEDSSCLSSLQFSSAYVKSKWKSSSEVERNRLLALTGLLVPQQREPHFASNQKQKSRNQKSMSDLLKSQIPSHALEFVQLEFMHWVCSLPHLPEEVMPPVEDYPDLESGEFVPPLQPQEKFLRWCSSHDDIGAEFCEYLSFCSLLKIFSQASGTSTSWSWCVWASNAYSELESQYQQHVGDSNIVALFSNDSSSSKLEKKNKAKSKKSPSNSTKEPANENKRIESGAQTNAKRKVKKAKPPKGLSEVLSTSVPLEVEEISSSHIVSSTVPSEISTITREPTADLSPSSSTLLSEYQFAEEKSDHRPAVMEPIVFSVVSESIPHYPISSADENCLERTTIDSTSQRDSETGSSASSQAEEGRLISMDNQESLPSPHLPSLAAPSVVSPLVEDKPTGDEVTVSISIEGKEKTQIVPKSETKQESSPSRLNASPPITLKNHSGDFLGTECQIFPKKNKQKKEDETPGSPKAESNLTDPQRNSANSHDSSSRIDLIRYDQQRKLTEILTEDILDMASNLYRIAQLRRPWQSAAIERVRTTVQSIWPQAQCDIFGSFGTGLAIPSSDVDIVVTGIANHPLSLYSLTRSSLVSIISGVVNQLQWWGGKPITPLAILSQHLQLQEWVSTVRAIEHTLMPVIKITTAPVPMPSIGAEARKDYRGVRRSLVLRSIVAHSPPLYPP